MILSDALTICREMRCRAEVYDHYLPKFGVCLFLHGRDFVTLENLSTMPLDQFRRVAGCAKADALIDYWIERRGQR